ncbi:hypothetical protein BGX31_011701 [Mortierella sp. GBA43]|nr:hypothetical protein BGX31_011701 [Mortierella sp. GBA43]
MSGPPVFKGTLDTSVFSDLQIHEYFRIYKPDEWDPVHFAQYSEAATLDDFKQDLRAIANHRICSSAYASEWLKYLKTPSGDLLCSKAQEVFAIKKSAVKNQTKFTSLQAEFSTGDNVKPKQTAKRIAGLKQRTSQLVRDQFSRPKFNFTRDHVLLMHDLEQELEEGDIQRTAASHDQLGNELVDIYRALNRELPVTSFPFDEIDGEDTFVHKTLHSIFSTVFKGFHIRWANKAARGSRERRKEDKKEGLRPDYQVLKNDVPLLYLEVKSLASTTEQEYLRDRWKLANMAKDELDASYHKHIRLPFMTVIQIFDGSQNPRTYKKLLQRRNPIFAALRLESLK